MDFSEQLKTIRKERGLTQEQLANELMVSRQAISNWENNKNLPDLCLCFLLCKDTNSLINLFSNDVIISILPLYRNKTVFTVLF